MKSCYLFDQPLAAQCLYSDTAVGSQDRSMLGAAIRIIKVMSVYLTRADERRSRACNFGDSIARDFGATREYGSRGRKYHCFDYGTIYVSSKQQQVSLLARPNSPRLHLRLLPLQTCPCHRPGPFLPPLLPFRPRLPGHHQQQPHRHHRRRHHRQTWTGP
jgi:hypothetical protein